MKRDILHTPEGVRDIYSRECREKKLITEKINKTCENFGFNNIETPTFEYFDVFNKERGSVPSNEMFKCFDHHGNTLVLRPDVTPSIARCAAKFFKNSKIPVKLCYTADVFINHENAYRGQMKQITTVGAESMGYGDADEDFEIIALAVEAMKSSGLEDFEVEIGNVKFFKGLLSETGLSADDEEMLISLINEKNYIAVENFIDGVNADSNVKQALLALPGLFGPKKDVISKARNLTSTKESLQALDELERLYDKLCKFGYEKYVSFDLGTLSTHSYYTGIIFHAYTFGTGDAVLNGGRYDKLIAQFGVKMPAVGFSILIDKLLDAVRRQGVGVKVDNNGIMFVFTEDMKDVVMREAFEVRKAGIRANVLKSSPDIQESEYREYGVRESYEKIVFLYNGNRKEVEL